MFITIDLQLGNMRKDENFVFYPKDESSQDFVIIQSDRRIAKIDLRNGQAILSKGRTGGAFFVHLMPALGATEIILKDDQLKAVKEKVNSLQTGPVRIF